MWRLRRPMARSLRAQDLNRVWRKRSATGPSEKAQKAIRHFVAAVSRGRSDAGDGVRHPAADRPDGSRPLECRIQSALCLWNLLVDRGFINGREIRGLNGQNTEANAGRSAPRWRPRPHATPAPGCPAGLRLNCGETYTSLSNPSLHRILEGAASILHAPRCRRD